MKKDLTQGSIKKHLIQISLPMVVSIFASMSFNLVDTYFVGQLGVDQLAALSFSFPVVITFLNLSIGVAIGSSSVLSRMLGLGQDEKVKTLSSLLVLIGCLLGVVITIIGVTTIPLLFETLGATPQQIIYCEEYMLYAYPAMGFRLIAICISGVYRANGITLIPSLSMLVATLVNFLLDPLLIFGVEGFIPALGITGAGIATLGSNIAALLFEFYMAFFKYHFFSLNLKEFDKERLKEVFKIAAPASVANALNPLALNVANFLIAKKVSTLAVAGFGIAIKIQFFSMIPVLAMSAGIGPIVGQNIGRKLNDRAKEVMKLGFKSCFFWGALQTVVLMFSGTFLAQFFTDEIESIQYADTYLKWVSLSLFGYSFVIISSAILNALGRAIQSFILIFARSFGVFLVLYSVLVHFDASNAVIYSIAISNIIVGLYSIKRPFSIQKNLEAK